MTESKPIYAHTPNTLPAVTDETARRIAELEKRATESPVETWQPEEGEVLCGIIAGTQIASGAYGENHQVLIRGQDGCTKAAWLTVWLRENLKAQGAVIGDLAAITFLGKKTSPMGRQYNAYSLIIEKMPC